MDKQRILITGGLGFIGSHTAVELVEAGYEVVIIDDLSNANSSVLDRIKKITGQCPAFYPVSLLDTTALQLVFQQEQGLRAVIHFAAFKAVGESVQQPLKYYHNNLVSLINLLQHMESAGIGNIVFSSSATVYGTPDHLPVAETAAFKKALSAYGSTKQMGEEILEKTTATRPVRAIALRYFNPAGAHPSNLIGEWPSGIPGNLVPYITQTAAGIRPELTVYGNDYDTPDGTCLRDYIHVMDLAQAHVESCTRLIRGQSAPFEVYNIGTGTAVSVLQLIHAFEEFNQVRLPYKIGPRRSGDTAALYADVQKAAQVLGWKAMRGVKDIVTSAWHWQQQLK